MTEYEGYRARQAELRDEQAMATAIAVPLWRGMTDNERAMVRFGIFPADKMRVAEMQLASRDGARLLAVALMACAKADGGMRA